MLRVFLRTMCTVSTHMSLKHNPPLSVFGLEGRYVSALYSASKEKNELDATESGLKAIAKVLSKPKIQDFLNTSLLSRNEKAEVLRDFGGAASLPSTAVNFLMMVAENGRLKLLRRMIKMFMDIMVAHRNEALCEVITAEPLDDGTRAKLMAVLEKLVKGKKIYLIEKVDKSIIGGIIVGVENKHIDLSIARRLLMFTNLVKMPV